MSAKKKRPTKRVPTLSASLLYDMHCHVSFADGPRALACTAGAAGIEALSATVLPAEYRTARDELASCPHIHVALGLHPWWVADGNATEEDLRLFERLAPTAPLIGEIGLDFARERGEDTARRRQSEALERALIACCADSENAAKDRRDTPDLQARPQANRRPPHVAPHAASHAPRRTRKTITLHAVRSAGAVLDLLVRTGAAARHACIFHWFSGTSDELHRAIEIGCSFSVGSRMLATKRGRAYAQAIPAARLLLETDEPPRQGAPFAADTWKTQLENTLAQLADLRRTDAEQLRAQIAANSCILLKENS